MITDELWTKKFSVPWPTFCEAVPSGLGLACLGRSTAWGQRAVLPSIVPRGRSALFLSEAPRGPKGWGGGLVCSLERSRRPGGC